MPTSPPGSVAPTRQTTVLGAHHVSFLERVGSDPPVLLLHGWGANAASFTGLLRRAKTPRRLVALDLPGFGESPLGVTDWTRAGYAALVQELIRERGWERVALLGHSYGGGVALRLAGEPPAPVDRLLLCAPSGLLLPNSGGPSGRVRTFHALRRSAETVLPARLAAPTVEWLRQRMGSADYRSAGPLRPILVRAVQEDLTEAAQRVQVPTLIIWGGRDLERPLEPYGRQLRQLISSSELVEFPTSGHFPFVDEPARFAAVFDSFVDARL
ncbi:MAG TPA: alpha/beta hydrolase [Candidatus Acidoferrales bacterium]|nr:alpha/beta hydrolase [Candidatus Acidoferrales bacterium]